MQIAFEAIPFGYGPASEIVAIAREIRARCAKDPRLVAVGDLTSYRIFASGSLFDEVYRFDYDTSTLSPEIESVLESSDAVISGHSPKFLDAVDEASLSCFVVNTLDWMQTIDEETLTEDAHRYYVPWFPGADQTASENETFRIDPIRNNHTLADVAKTHNEPEEGFVCVNFGGMESPLGSNDELAVATATEIVAAAESTDQTWRLQFNGGGKAMQRIDREIESDDVELEMITETRPHERFLADIAQCEVLFTVPGLNITYEALYYRAPMMFLLPMNYSQHLQLRCFPTFLSGFEHIDMNDIDPFDPLPPDLPETEGVELSLKQGQRFSGDRGARDSFREQISSYLRLENRDGLEVRQDLGGEPRIEFNGAEQIASDVLAHARN